MMSSPSLSSSHTVFLSLSAVAALVDVGDLDRLADLDQRRRPASPGPVIMRNSVVLPAPLGPMTPTMPPGGSLKSSPSISSLSPNALRRPVGLDHERRPGAGPAGCRSRSVSLRAVPPPARTAPRSGRGAPCSSWRGPWGWSAPTRARAASPCAASPPASPPAPGAAPSARATRNSCPARGCPGRGRARGSSRRRCRGSSGRG